MLGAIRLVNAALALTAAAAAFRTTDFSSLSAGALSLAVMIWLLLPFPAFDFLMRRNHGLGWPFAMAAAGAIISAVAAAVLYARLLLIDALPAEQSLAALLVLPAYQLGFAAMTLAIIAFGRMMMK